MHFNHFNIYKLSFVFVFLILFSINLKASHLKAGEFNAVRSATDPLTYKITLNLYIEDGPVTQNEVKFFFGDGTDQTVPYLSSTNIGNNTIHNVFVVDHTFPSAGFYKISIDHQFRNFKILNMPSPGQTDFYLELGLLINPFLGLNQTPVMTIPPIDIGAINKIYKHNPGAYDPDGDSISFKLITSLLGPDQPVNGYVLPNDPKFGGQSTNGGNAILTLDEQTGDLVWNTPSGFGSDPRYYNIAIMVEEWRAGIRMSYVIRDMQILIQPTNNNPPIVTIPKDTCIEVGNNYVSSFFARDPDGDNVELKAYGAPFSFGATAVISGQNSVFPTGVFNWLTTCTHVRNQPYDVVVQATDILNLPKLVDYQTWRLRVKGPRIANVVANPIGADQMKVDWDMYPCSNASTIEIYRSECVGPTPPINGCNTNLPPGYVKVGEVPANINTYTDNDNGIGLKSGLTYCYILLVKFQFPALGQSYPSNPICNALSNSNPLPIKLLVTTTDPSNGSIFLNWNKPPALTPPVTYEIERTSLVALNAFTTIQSTTDTFFVDNNLNTVDSIYTYRVKVQNTINRSAPVQQLDLAAIGGNAKVDLSWKYTVPWNVDSIQIFRSVQSSAFSKIATVSSSQLIYTDVTVNNCDTIQYYLIQYGKYCDASITDTTQLVSAIETAYPVDDSPLPAPLLNVLGCNGDLTVFKNTLNWTNLFEPICNRLLNYRLYYAEHSNESFTLLKELNDTFYVDIDSLSTAGCYYVVGVNTKGIEGNRSNVVCVDDCIYYQLPNLITVNSDLKNDIFEAYPVPRGVKEVTFSVYNIWGEKVYYEENSKKIQWTGVTNQGTVSSGVYYYEAVVTYHRRVNKSDEQQVIKSWLHILRDE